MSYNCQQMDDIVEKFRNLKVDKTPISSLNFEEIYKNRERIKKELEKKKVMDNKSSTNSNVDCGVIPKIKVEGKDVSASQYLNEELINQLKLIDWTKENNKKHFNTYIKRIYYYKKSNVDFQIYYRKYEEDDEKFIRIYLEVVPPINMSEEKKKINFKNSTIKFSLV